MQQELRESSQREEWVREGFPTEVSSRPSVQDNEGRVRLRKLGWDVQSLLKHDALKDVQ